MQEEAWYSPACPTASREAGRASKDYLDDQLKVQPVALIQVACASLEDQSFLSRTGNDHLYPNAVSRAAASRRLLFY